MWSDVPVRAWLVAAGAACLASMIAGFLWIGSATDAATPPARHASAAVPRADLGINLFGIQTYNREQVFTNLVTQSEWFLSRGEGWSAVPPAQLDAGGWIRALGRGEFATRPFFISAKAGKRSVRCVYDGEGSLSGGGVAVMREQGDGFARFDLTLTGAEGEGGWLQLDSTSAAAPLRNLDCRDEGAPRDRVFEPAFLDSLKGFAALRFLDWQRVNDNPVSRWSTRSREGDGAQVGAGGVAIEHMVRLANEAGADPWFVMPHAADADQITHSARYVHDHPAPERTVYVELGNEIWNDMFAAARQARDEGIKAGLTDGDPFRGQMRRYAQKSRDALKIWTEVYRVDPHRLVRVVSAVNAYPDSSEMILGFEDMARWIDALATAPYIHLNTQGRGAVPADVDWVYARMDAAIDETFDFAERNRAIATRFGKRFITYEGGQHLVTRDLGSAARIQRDQRMERVYTRYLEQWRERFGDRMMLYATTTPISEHGSWGLREYGGQPLENAPKARAVQRFLSTTH